MVLPWPKGIGKPEVYDDKHQDRVFSLVANLARCLAITQKAKCIKHLPQAEDILTTLVNHPDMHSCLGGMRVPDLLYTAYQSTRN